MGDNPNILFKLWSYFLDEIYSSCCPFASRLSFILYDSHISLTPGEELHTWSPGTKRALNLIYEYVKNGEDLTAI